MSDMPVSRQAITLVDGYVPVIDLGLDLPRDQERRAAVAEAIATACANSGFLVVVGHEVAQSAIRDVYAAAREFYAQPAETKAEVARDPGDPLQRGHVRLSRLEMFSANRVGEPAEDGTLPTLEPGVLSGPNRWPEVPGFREAYLRYYGQMTRLAEGLTRLFALALDLPESWFADKFDHHMTPLMINYYPGRPDAPTGTFRNDEHTDFSALTVLYQDDAPGGLQIQDHGGQWVDVPPLPGSFVVNLGQLMTVWTNDKWASTVHRVVNPPAELAHRDRISIAYFYTPNADAVISCIPTCVGEDKTPTHKDVRAADFFLAKSRRAFVQRSLGLKHT